jgi:hypothetical protein
MAALRRARPPPNRSISHWAWASSWVVVLVGALADCWLMRVDVSTPVSEGARAAPAAVRSALAAAKRAWALAMVGLAACAAIVRQGSLPLLRRIRRDLVRRSGDAAGAERQHGHHR